MMDYPFNCRVVLPGIKCAYKALHLSEINAHEMKHLRNIKSKKRNKSRYYEVPVAPVELSCKDSEQSPNESSGMGHFDKAVVRAVHSAESVEWLETPCKSSQVTNDTNLNTLALYSSPL